MVGCGEANDKGLGEEVDELIDGVVWGEETLSGDVEEKGTEDGVVRGEDIGMKVGFGIRLWEGEREGAWEVKGVDEVGMWGR